MNIDHTAGALLAGLFRSNDESDRRRFDRTADGTVVLEFQVETFEPGGNRRGTTRHPAIVYGPLAVRVATTFAPGDLVVVSGDIGPIPGHRLPIASVNVTNAFRLCPRAMVDNAPTVNVAYVVGTAAAATECRLRDGTVAAVLTIACVCQSSGQNPTEQTAILTGSIRDRARSIAVGDTIRVDGRIAQHCIGQRNMWAVTCTRLTMLQRVSGRPILDSAMRRPLQRTA